MRGKALRFCVIVTAAVVLSLAVTASAFASVHVTYGSAAAGDPATLTVSLVSTGDAGAAHGNMNDGTSPIFPDPALGFGGWFNQNVTIGDLVIGDPDVVSVTLGGAFWQKSADGSTWGPATAFTDAATVSGEGLYSVTATGTEDTQEADVATGAITPAFGIDKTKPTSSSDVVPIYSGTAVVTITATDTLSGVENLQTSVDGGPWDWSNDADAGSSFMVPVTFGPGSHTLSWHVFDNAGNIESHSVSFIVRPADFVPNVSLSIARFRTGRHNGHVEYHRVVFSGNVDALASPMPLTVVVQKWSNRTRSYHPYTQYLSTVPAFGSRYSLRKTLPDGQYRAMSSFDGGSTSWKKFKTN